MGVQLSVTSVKNDSACGRAIDPDRMPIAVGLFERYALGNVSAKDLADETGFAESRIRMILMNPLSNG